PVFAGLAGPPCDRFRAEMCSSVSKSFLNFVQYSHGSKLASAESVPDLFSQACCVANPRVSQTHFATFAKQLYLQPQLFPLHAGCNTALRAGARVFTRHS